MTASIISTPPKHLTSSFLLNVSLYTHILLFFSPHILCITGKITEKTEKKNSYILRQEKKENHCVG